jgi:hypothetical protein
MVTQELLDYISKQKQTGLDTNTIRQALINNGWNAQDVDQAFASTVSPQMTPTPTAPARDGTSPDDAAAAVKKMGTFKASWRLFT